MTLVVVVVVVWFVVVGLLLAGIWYLGYSRRVKADARSYLDAMRQFNTPDPDRKE